MDGVQSFLTHMEIRTILYVVVPLVALGIRFGWRFFKQVNSEDWPAIQGKCTFVDVTNKVDRYELKVLYSFKLATEKFANCGAFYKDFFTEAQANQWAHALREMAIPVHYHPENPEKSILWESDLESIVKPLNK